MTTIDWSLIRLQYELFGASEKELAEEYDISPSILSYAAQENGWKRLPIAETLQDWQNIDKIDKIDEDLVTEVNSRLKVLRTIRESVLSPKYIALETAILSRALELVKTIDPQNEGSTDRLKIVTDIFKLLKELSFGKIAAPVPGTPDIDKSLKINILNYVGDKKSHTQEPIELKIKERARIEDGQAHIEDKRRDNIHK